MLAALGAENPLPDLGNVSYVHSTVTWDDTLAPEDTRFMRYGRVSSILPYLSQDGYTRRRAETEKDTVVLENEYVRAEFLPWMGGRMRSMKCCGREMLHVNPVIQPCNLALRNAWCSGGVEWNMGIRGHSMLTNEPLFTEFLSLPDGTRGVRFYEYERIRGVAFRLEAYLPPESRFLFVQPRIENPAGNGETPMYWWSNIAVPESGGVRVIAPADTAILSLYDAGQYRMLRVPLPYFDGADLSRPCGIRRSLDVFFDVKKGGLPFITALPEDGTGLLQCSTAFMAGRKLFVWGMGQGGRHWQKFLSDGTENYIEIQAGIAKTQQDHIPMPENTVWSWLEAYGRLDCPVDGLDYPQAAAACEKALYQIITPQALEREFSGRGRAIAAARGEIVLSGSGWGALENARRRGLGLPPLSSQCRFPASTLGDKQRPWKTLLDTGAFPDADPLKAPESYMTGAFWTDRLKNAPQNGAALYQLGIALHAAGQKEKAWEALLACLEKEENPFACRALARMCLLADEEEGCLSYYRRAMQAKPGLEPLLLEYGQALLSLKKWDALLCFLDALDEDKREKPRFLYLRAAAYAALGRFREARAILARPLIIPDMREGELSLSEVWFDMHQRQYGLSRQEAQARFPLPEALDFRMHE